MQKNSRYSQLVEEDKKIAIFVRLWALPKESHLRSLLQMYKYLLQPEQNNNAAL